MWPFEHCIIGGFYAAASSHIKRVSSRWVKIVLAGIHTSQFKSHGTTQIIHIVKRNADVSLQEILNTAGWASAQCNICPP